MFSILKIAASMAILSTLAVAAPARPVKALATRDAPSCTSDEIKNAALYQLNAHRKLHGAPPLTYSDTLAQYAQNVAYICVERHSFGPYGENLYLILPGVDTTWAQATKIAIFDWVKEIWSYDYNNPDFSMATGHATAVLWKSTSEAGCAWARCRDFDIFVCEFDKQVPNVLGSFGQNVLPAHTPL